MKIGIITLPLHTNYGGILQAWALQTVLERMGHEVKVIDRKAYSPYNGKTRIDDLKSLLKHILKRMCRRESVFQTYSTKDKNYHICRQYTDRFIKQYIHRYEIESFSEIKEDNFDCYVVGSDQIWRPASVKKMWRCDVRNAFLGFAKEFQNVKRIAYATSFGVGIWEYNRVETFECAALARMFDRITIREAEGVKLCNEYLHIKAEHVLDPTLLLTREDYIALVKASKVSASPGQLLNYVLDRTSDKLRFAQSLERESGLKLFTVNSDLYNLTLPIDERIQPPLEQWLRGFMDAEMVVTDSFHACVFSIIFNKPFWVIGNIKRGMARFNSLLRLFGLENRLLNNINNSKIDVLQPINWDHVNNLLSELQVKSLAKLSL